MTFSFDNLQPEAFTNQQTWMDFLTAFTELIEEQIRTPIKQLEDIRHFVEDTDPFILTNTIKTLGFDIPADLIKHNVDRLSRSVYMLSMFHEISGLDGFERSIEFVLGREVIVRDKYTNNYVDFYNKPQGPLLKDGGDWYKTTHISLGMELVSGDRALVLPINKTLQDRLLEAYYEFAPINQVVDDFFFIQKVYAQLFLAGKIYINPTRRKTFGAGVDQIQRISTVGPTTMASNGVTRFFAEVVLGSNPCFDISEVAVGQAASALTDEDIGELPVVANTVNQFTFNNTEGHIWFASPVELGAVTFSDTNGFIGGWDGASWAEGSYGENPGEHYGPVVVRRTIDGQVRSWNVYRTDIPALGNYTFNVSYALLRANSCDFVEPVVTAPEGPIDAPECVTQTINLFPIYDVGLHGLDTGIELTNLNQTNAHTNNFQLSLDVQNGYGYLSYPTALGFATFTDSNNFEGGWDGASWAEGSIGDLPGEHYGPIVVQRDIAGNLVDYYIYRTDYPDIGQFTWQVAFQNPGLNLTVSSVDCASSGCVNGYPTICVGPSELNTDAELVQYTETVLESTDNLTLTIDSDQHTYFTYPKAMGFATFTDSNGYVGGWDGASWTEGSIGENPGEHYGPITVMRTIEGITSEWYVYRTDFEGIAQTYTIEFQVPGVCVVSDSPVCVVSGTPRYGSGFELHTGAHIDALTPLPDTNTATFSLVVNSGQYGYFASPAALGAVTFTDSLGIEGGWDGARWPQGTIGNAAGPALVWRNVGGNLVPWYLYRTDFPALGAVQFTATYERDLDVGDTASCNIGMPLASASITGSAPLPVQFPVYGTAPAGLDTDYELQQLTNSLPTNANQQFSITVPNGQYGYFAHPSNLGIAKFVDELGYEGAWDGASWPASGTIGANNGPIAIMRNIGGVVQTWYVYRTDFPGIGAKQYTVSFGHAQEDNGYRVIRVVQPVWSTDRPDLVTIDALGNATFRQVYVDTIVHITATYEGISDTIAVLLRPNMPDVLTMNFLGMDQVIGGQNAIYGLEGHYDDGYLRPVEGAEYFVLSPYARFVGTTLFTDNPPQDTALFLTAKKVNDNGVEVLATKEVLLKRMLVELHVTQITITGPSTLQENTSAQYSATVLYSNGSSQQEYVAWSSSAAGLYIDTTGLATAGQPLTNFNAIITAQFQFKGIVYEATKNVTVNVVELTAVSLQVFGQNTIRELSSGQFNAIVTWSNGNANITPASWSCSKFSISREGVLETGSVGGTTSISIQARAEGLSATKVVTVYNTPVVLEHITIVGPNSVNANDLTTYRIYAHYSDNKDYEITASMYVEGNPTFVTITGSTLVFSDSPTSMVELVAVYNDGIRDYTARKQVVLINSVITLAGLSILGPSEVLESKRIALSAIALYSDGTQDIVEPEWSVRNLDSVNEPEAHADIVSPGVVQGRLVTEDKTILVIARYFTQVVEYPVIVRDYTPPGPDVPVSYYISGPDSITTKQVGSYALVCQFENCPSEIMLSNDWALDVASDIALLDSNGFLRSVNLLPAIVNVTATWEYNGHAIQISKEVEIRDDVVINNLLVTGPANMSEQSSSTFNAEYFYSDEDVVAGTGHVPEANQIAWSVSGSSAASINAQGVLTMGDIDMNTPITVTATFNNGQIQLVASLGIMVAGSPPPVVAHNLIGGSSVLEGEQLTFVVEVFRQNMSQTTGTGIVVNPATIQYHASQGGLVNGLFTAPMVNSNTIVSITISGQYETYPFSITRQITVLNKAPIDMLLSGPSSINAGATAQFTAEVFVTGQVVVPGTGSSSGIVYSLVGAPATVTISATGLVTVPANVEDVSFTVSATAGTITRSQAVSVPGLPVFSTIKSVRQLTVPDMLLPDTMRITSSISSEDTLLVSVVTGWDSNNIPTENRVYSFDTVNYSNAATKMPVIRDMENTTYPSTHRVNSNVGAGTTATMVVPMSSLTGTHDYVNSFSTTYNAGQFTRVAGVPSDLMTFTYADGPVNNPVCNIAFAETLEDGTRLVIYFVNFSSTYNNLNVANTLSVLRVYKIVGSTYVHVQDIFDPYGASAYRTHTVSGIGTSYLPAQIVSVSVGLDILEVSFIVLAANSTPTTFTQTQRGRTDYFRWNGSQFVRFVAGTVSTAGLNANGSKFFKMNGKTYVVCIAVTNISANSTTSTINVRELGSSNVIQKQLIHTYPYYIPRHMDVSTVKNIFVHLDNSGKTAVYRIDPTTATFTLARLISYSDFSPGFPDAGLGDMPTILRDGRTIAFFVTTVTANPKTRTLDIWLLEG